MLFPHTKLLFRFEFECDDFFMLIVMLELNQGSFVNDLIQIMSLLLWKLVKRLLSGVRTRTQTIKYVRKYLCISTTIKLLKFRHIREVFT